MKSFKSFILRIDLKKLLKKVFNNIVNSIKLLKKMNTVEI